MKEAIINKIKRVLGTESKDLWFNNNTEHHQELEFGECIPFVILKEYLLGEGYKEDEDTDVWETDVCSYTSCPNCGNNVNTNQI